MKERTQCYSSVLNCVKEGITNNLAQKIFSLTTNTIPKENIWARGPFHQKLSRRNQFSKVKLEKEKHKVLNIT